MKQTDLAIEANEGYSLAATLYEPDTTSNGRVIIINSATAIPRQFYRYFATFFAEQGYTVISYDYRGIGGSRPKSLRGFQVLARDWASDMGTVLDWADSQFSPQQLFIVGHSIGGQMMGLLENSHKVDAMITTSAQSGYWGMQGGNQKYAVAFHMYLTFPVLCRLYGYMPWSLFSSAEDLPKGVALEWAAWCRNPKYLLGDDSLPLERYAQFKAPILAYSFDDDDWGTAKAVDAMMFAYPNVERRHVIPAERGIKKLGHVGFFRKTSEALWQDVIEWLENVQVKQGATI